MGLQLFLCLFGRGCGSSRCSGGSRCSRSGGCGRSSGGYHAVLVCGAGSKEDGGYCQDNQRASQCPCGFFNHIGSLSYTHNLVGCSKIRGKSAAFGLLDEYDECEQDSHDDCQNYEY